MSIRLWFVLIIIKVCIHRSSSEDPYVEKLVNDHNKYRHRHHAPALKYDLGISNKSLQWAQFLASPKNTKGLHHSENDMRGENIWYLKGQEEELMLPNGPDPVRDWYNEIYRYPSDNLKEWEHFTQVIWKNSANVGCGIATSKVTGLYWVVCRYSPPGNVKGQFDANVLQEDGLPFTKRSEIYAKAKYYTIIAIALIIILAEVIIFIYRGIRPKEEEEEVQEADVEEEEYV